MAEFSLIRKYFAERFEAGAGVRMGIGDDAAVLTLPETHELVVTTDTLVEGVHFLRDTRPEDLAYKALAVNLSDLAAMGARPLWFTLSLSMPEVHLGWLEAFSESLRETAGFYGISLVGGDTVRGPLSVGITAMGQVPRDSYLRREGARPGDYLYVTGTLGDAAAGLQWLQGTRHIEQEDVRNFLHRRLLRPTPRVAAGIALRQLATACIDVSDGLLGDLQHILDASGGLGARIDLDALPASKALDEVASDVELWELALGGGDDYELCFTVPEERRADVASILSTTGVQATRIGRIQGPGAVEFFHLDKPVRADFRSFQHFDEAEAP